MISFENIYKRFGSSVLALAASVLGLACLSSCSIFDRYEADEPERDARGMVDISFYIGNDGASTKATGILASNESAVNSWALLLVQSGSSTVFKAMTSEGASAISVSVPAGNYTAYAVVNYPTAGNGAFTPSDGMSVSALTGTVSYLENNSLANLVMFGSKDVSLTSSGSQSIPVSRLVAKLGIKKISVDFSDPSLAGKAFVIKGIYVTNAYLTSTLGADYSAAALNAGTAYWQNRMGFQSSSALNPLLAETGLTIPVTAGASYTTEHYFYCYPNQVLSTADDRNMSAWSKRCTRMVIEATVGGTTCYYPITVANASKGIIRNNTYIADEVIIQKMGYADPEGNGPAVLQTNWSVYAAPWDNGGTINETS